jgi:hypothetical protein
VIAGLENRVVQTQIERSLTAPRYSFYSTIAVARYKASEIVQGEEEVPMAHSNVLTPRTLSLQLKQDSSVGSFQPHPPPRESTIRVSAVSESALVS